MRNMAGAAINLCMVLLSFLLQATQQTRGANLCLTVQGGCEGIPELVKNISVADSVSFSCKFSDDESVVPSWVINSTVYYWSSLPQDYKYSIDIDEQKYSFIIPEAKLWMDNTQYGCIYGDIYDLMGCLFVSFDLQGPSHYKINGDKVFVSCSNHLFREFNFYVLWSINAIIYDITRLPLNYSQNLSGLTIDGRENLQNVTLQCLVYSDLLLEESFYRSEMFDFTPDILGSLSDTLHQVNDGTFEFDYNKFHFTALYKRIYWKLPDCISPVEYELINWSPSGFNSVMLNETNFTLPTSNLSEGELHYIYIVAKSNGRNCSMSKTVLDISPNVKTTVHYIIENTDFCLSTYRTSSYIWPKTSSHDEANCRCPALSIIFSNCSCFHENHGIFVFRVNESICWQNFPISYNNSVISVVNNELATKLPSPQIATRIMETHKVVIKDKPSPPIVTANGTGEDLCLIYANSFTGFSNVTEYITSVIDGTGLTFNFTQKNENEDTTCLPIPSPEKKLLSDNCGNLTLSIRSRNEVNLSDAATVLVPGKSNDKENLCTCFSNNVIVDISDIELASSPFLHLTCQSLYKNVNDTKFLVLINNETASNAANCFKNTTLKLTHQASGSYNVEVYWIKSNSNSMMCNVSSRTISLSSNSSLPWKWISVGIGGFILVLGIILALIIALIVSVCILCKKLKKKNKTIEDMKLETMKTKKQEDQK